jgi:PAS domain S-box-containing protein
VWIDSSLIFLQGNWHWDLHATHVFCSDVIMALPLDFEGTRGIIHPDDLPSFSKALSASGGNVIPELCFRIITTYGEVRELRGSSLTVQHPEESYLPPEECFRNKALTEKELQTENQQLSARLHSFDFSEKITRSGSWYINTHTGETWYSDNVFRIYGLPPQSLNLHLNTFVPFIHPDDRELVESALHESLRKQLPLNLEFRILSRNDEEKVILQATRWEFNNKGEAMLLGVVEDRTEAIVREQETEENGFEFEFTKQLQLLGEQAANMGHWHVNLVTRKSVFSSNYYRIFGLKPRVPAGSFQYFLNYIHPDDREQVEEADKKLRKLHSVEDIDFRINRPDGKTRYLRQKGKVILYRGEPVVIGVIEDVSVERSLERKLGEMQENSFVLASAQSHLEETAGLGSWTRNLDTGKITWSDNFYHLLGYKAGSVELTERHITRMVHSDDRKKFTDAIARAAEELPPEAFQFRLIRLGVLHHMKASFRVVRDGERRIFTGVLQDITQEYLLKEELYSRLHLGESLTDNILDRVAITDANNNIILWNKRCEDVYGIKKDKAIGRNFFDVLPPLRTPEDIEMYNRVLEGETVHQHHVKGRLRREYHDLHLIPLRSEEGEVTGILHVVHDVTRERELHQSLSERLEFIEKLVDNSVDQIIVLDRNMNYIYWNKRSEEYYGLRREEVVGRNVLEVFPNVRDEPTYDDFRKALQGATVYLPARADEQQGAYNEVYLLPIKNDRGEVSSVLWITHDLSNEYLLRKEQQRAERVMNSIDEAYVELDGNQVLRYMNRRAEELWNLNREHWLGRNFRSHMRESLEPEASAIINKALLGNTAAQGEYFSATAGMWLYLSATPSAEGLIILFYDISDIKEARLKLEQEHHRLKEAQSIGKLGSFEWLRDTEKITWSDELYRIYGLEPQSEEITPEKLVEWTHPEDREFYRDTIMVSRETRDRMEFTHRIVLPDGTVRHMIRRIDWEADAQGRTCRIYGTVHDVTEYLQAEQEIKKGKDLLQSVFDASTMSFVVARAIYGDEGEMEDIECVYVNRVTREILKSDPTGKRLSHLFPGVWETPAGQVARDVMQSGVPADREFFYGEGGFNHWFRVTAHKLGDLLVTSAEDITEKKRAEAERLKHYTILEQSEVLAGMGSWEYDISTGNFIWSDGMYRLFALKEGAGVKPEIYVEYAAGSERNTALRIVHHLRRNFADFEEVLKLEKDGLKKILRIKGTVVRNRQGQPEKVLGVDLDITAAREAEEKINETLRQLEVQNRELQKKHEEITAFAFVASHDLKEPLRKMHTFSDWLLTRESGNLTDKARHYLSRISASVRRMDLLIEDVLVLTGIHGQDVKKENVCLDEVLETVLHEMNPLLQSTGAVVTAEKIGSICGSASQVSHLFRNILDNSIKFRKEGTAPEIGITARIEESGLGISPDAEPGRAYLALSFTDNGIGFDQKYARKVFDMFQRIHYKMPAEGTGMGLAICRKIMETHGGWITVESRVNEGSRFTCFFPLNGDRQPVSDEG